MPYQNHWEDRGVVTQYAGRTSDDDIEQAVRDAQGDARFDRLKWGLHDFLGCEGFTFSAHRMTEIAAIDRVATRSAAARAFAIAVVTDRPEVRAAVQAYTASGFNVHEVCIFASVDAARDWLSERFRPSSAPRAPSS